MTGGGTSPSRLDTVTLSAHTVNLAASTLWELLTITGPSLEILFLPPRWRAMVVIPAARYSLVGIVKCFVYFLSGAG